MYTDFAWQMWGVMTDPHLLVLSVIGVLLGIIFGCLPGISSTMALAILLPVTYALTPEGAMVFLMSVFAATVYGGSISAIMINIPGTPGAIVTQLEGYPMARKGKAGEAMFYSLYSSTIGGFIGLAVLMLVAPLVAQAAMQFRSPEFAMVTVLGLTMLAYSTPGSTFRGVLSGAIGLMCGMVGFDALTDVPRFTYGSGALLNGVELVPVTIGLFGLAEVMRNIDGASAIQRVSTSLGRLWPSREDIRRVTGSILRGSAIGIGVGAIPAAGSAIAVAVSYAQEQRLSKRSKEFGTGVPEGIAGPEAANNACIGGALIPMMTLGIPGDTMTAVLMGALLIHGLRPGPLLFEEHTGYVAAVYVSLFIGTLLTFVFGMILMRQFVRLLQAPSHILLVLIMLLCIVGAFAMRNNMTDVYVMIAFGVIGYIMAALEIPVAPLAFGLILGPLLEENLRRSLIVSDGSWMIFVERPIACTMLLLSVLALAYPMFAPALRQLWRRRLGNPDQSTS